MITLNQTLKIPSIGSRLDTWLHSKSWSGKRKWENYFALDKAQKIVMNLIQKFNISDEEAVKIVTDSMEEIINEIYDIHPLPFGK